MSEHFVRCVICEMIVPTEKTFVRDTGLTAGLEYTCIDCMNKEDNHQQRLDKVLEKFEYWKSCNTYNFRFTKTNMNEQEISLFTIRYSIDEGFYFVRGGVKQTISLATVEHLIADMEAQDE